MLKKLPGICALVFFLGFYVNGQISSPVTVGIIGKNTETLPGKILNIPFQITSQSDSVISIKTNIVVPEGFKLITRVQPAELNPGDKTLSIYSLQIPLNSPVGSYPVKIEILDPKTEKIFITETTLIEVGEIEKITMELVDLPDHIFAGESFNATFLVQNLGNTSKKIFIDTYNIDNVDVANLELAPGESSRITVSKATSAEMTDARKEYFRVQATVSGEAVQSAFKSVMVFPSQNRKIDRYYRYPVTFSATYLSTNQKGTYESAYQFELNGSGNLDVNGKHKLEFLARGPNSSELSFLGLYDQYYINYENKNANLFLGEKAFTFTPLTESSRFGLGTENKIILNNGLHFGFLYVKPRYYNQINDEFAVYSGYEKDSYTAAEVYFVSKKETATNKTTYLGSINTKLRPFEKTTVELELSRGLYNTNWDNAIRANVNTQFSVFRLSGNYIYTGKFYPGYFSNSKFYSGTFSAHITPKLNLGFYARQDFTNAQLDTFFINAPYSKSYQTSMTYNIAQRTYLKLYWREYEKKDRLVLDKFHYKTKSLNTQFSRRLRKFDYVILGEYGRTTNYRVESLENEQTTYRGTLNMSYRFNASSAIRVFGSWSNINSFVSDEQRNLTAGLSVNSRIGKNFSGSFHIQNAYDIDDYYRNRNLMQLNLGYDFLKNHTISFRSFYTIFRQQTDNPEFTLSASYVYRLGVPLKQIIQTGEVSGRITNDNNEPVEGIVVSLLNKSAITNKYGEFTLKSVPPGNHLLAMDRTKLEISETTNIPNPIEIEVIPDQTSVINFRITEGARIEGNFYEKNQSSESETPSLKNIIVELKSEFEQYRIVTNDNGEFVFPLVRPGNWNFHIYINSLPAGYETKSQDYHFQLKPGDKIVLPVEIQKKQRNIIFKSQGISLSTSGNSKTAPTQLSTPSVDKSKTAAPAQKQEESFYSIQIGAFRKKLKPDARFLKGLQFDFEKEIDNLNKYFIGKFVSPGEAQKELKQLQQKFRGAFIVRFENGELVKQKD